MGNGCPVRHLGTVRPLGTDYLGASRRTGRDFMLRFGTFPYLGFVRVSRSHDPRPVSGFVVVGRSDHPIGIACVQAVIIVHAKTKTAVAARPYVYRAMVAVA